jgi:F0F1-type ATP synthase assembly protein I
MPEQNPDPRETGRFLVLAQTGIEMVTPLAIGAFIDYKMGWSPWATVAGAVLGFVGGIVHLIVIAQKMGRDEEDKKKNRP